MSGYDRQIINQADIHLSVISHGQCSMVLQLLDDLSRLPCHKRFQITITLNIKESCEFTASQYPFAIKIIENTKGKSFSANHNNAFHSPPDKKLRQYFVVINPDIRIFEDVFLPLSNTIDAQPQLIGVISPAVKNNKGQLEDSARELPTPWRIVKKLFGQGRPWHYSGSGSYQPDWIAGMFMFFKAETYATMGGFNESYFLYYEDVELCSRLWLDGFCVLVEPSVAVIHNAQRSSHRNIKYMRWHLASLLRFFLSAVYKKARLFQHRRTLNQQGSG